MKENGMLSAEDIYARLEARRQDLNLSQAQVGKRAFGRADNAPFQALRRGSLPSVQKLEALCHAVGWDFYFGPPKASTGFSDMGTAAMSAELAPAPVAGRADHVPIPFHEEACPGAGAPAIALSRSWLRETGITVDHISAITVPTGHAGCDLRPGDIALIDQAVRDDLAGQVFAYFPGPLDQVRFARLLRTGASEIVRSSGQPEQLTRLDQGRGFRVLGAVVWSMRAGG